MCLVVNNSWEERIEAGEALAPAAGERDADAQLLGLLRDPENTAVTLYTALALFEQRTAAAIRLVVLASARTDDNHRDWIDAALGDFLGSVSAEEQEFVRHTVRMFQNDGDPVLAQEAREWVAWYRWG